MARQHPEIPLQCCQTGQRGGHLLVIAPRKVGTADLSAKQGVPGKQCVPCQEGDGAGCVPRGVERLDGQSCQVEALKAATVG